MATCDPDGRIFEALMDRQKCLAMEMSESLIDAQTVIRAAIAPLTLDKVKDAQLRIEGA